MCTLSPAKVPQILECPHDDDSEKSAKLDDVPHEDGDAVKGVAKGEHLALGGGGDDVAVACNEIGSE